MKCQALKNGNTPCPNDAEENSNFCPTHGGKSLATQDRETLFSESENAYLKKISGRADRLICNPQALTLEKEIGIASVTLERLLERIQSDDKLIDNLGLIQSVMRDLMMMKEKNVRLAKELGTLRSVIEIEAMLNNIAVMIIGHFDDYQKEFDDEVTDQDTKNRLAPKYLLERIVDGISEEFSRKT